MTDDLILKKQTMLRNYRKALENIHDLEAKTDYEIDNLVRIKDGLQIDAGIIHHDIVALDQLPDSCLRDPSTALESLFISGVNISESQLNSTDNLKTIFNARGAMTTYLSSGAATTATASAVTNTIVSDIVENVTIQYPTLRYIIKEIDRPTDIEKRKIISSKLRNISDQIADEFDGSWMVLSQISNPDRFKQSAHSMREVVSILLQALAPDDNLKKICWYKTEFEENGEKITQKMRVKYAILGFTPPDSLFEDQLKTVYDLMDELRDRYNLLSGKAHARGEHSGDLSLVESYLKETQDTIDLILKLRDDLFSSIALA